MLNEQKLWNMIIDTYLPPMSRFRKIDEVVGYVFIVLAGVAALTLLLVALA